MDCKWQEKRFGERFQLRHARGRARGAAGTASTLSDIFNPRNAAGDEKVGGLASI